METTITVTKDLLKIITISTPESELKEVIIS